MLVIHGLFLKGYIHIYYFVSLGSATLKAEYQVLIMIGNSAGYLKAKLTKNLECLWEITKSAAGFQSWL